MIYEDQRGPAEDYVATIMADSVASQYVDGIAMHWYDDKFTGSSVLDNLNGKYPDKWIYYTEVSRAL